MNYLYRIFIDDESVPVDSGDAMPSLPKVGDRIDVSRARRRSQHTVVKVLDRTDEPASGGQARCDVWVESDERSNDKAD